MPENFSLQIVVPVEESGINALNGLGTDMGQILKGLEDLSRRLARTETRLCKLMDAMGVDPAPDNGYGR
jgi:hypothetical protein